MRTRPGNLLQLAVDGEFDLIAHGANCLCAMGAGIALQVKLRFPEAFASDARTAKGDWEKLGTYSMATVLLPSGARLSVANLYTQFYPGGPRPPRDGRPERLEAIRSSLARLRAEVAPGARVGFPKIGAGLAGGEWAEIREVLEEIFPAATVVVPPAQRVPGD